MRASGPAAPWLGSERESWLAEVRSWLRSGFGVERLEVVKERPWSSVLRGAIGPRKVYFKAAGRGGRHEAALVDALARDWPDLLPEPLGVDAERGWMLLPDCGQTLRDAWSGRDALPIWEALLPRYAELQIASAGQPERWLALGVPDRRLDVLPGLFARLLDDDEALDAGMPEALSRTECQALLDLRPELEEQCRALAALPGAAALEHGDLHDGNVLVRGSEFLIFDWGDSNLCHPFTSNLIVRARVATDVPECNERLRDAYLEPWTAHASRAELSACYARALWLAHLGRALDWQWMLAGAGEAAREWRPQLAGWLRRWLAEPRP